jgi:hypothetical protein
MPAKLAAVWLMGVTALGAARASATTLEPPGALGLHEPIEMAGLNFPFLRRAPVAPMRPHPAVARIVVPEGNTAVSYGSGTLVDVRDEFGLVVTNWHVVRDGTGEVEVIFPDGFCSKARPLKVDADWDLAALVIWRPPVEPVPIAAVAPQPGDQLTICGYGSGEYRAAAGRCTQYYAPALNLPQHMVELDVEARQGDSGGPIFNDRGELAGVLFGAGRGTTLGSFGGRVGSFFATLAPDIGRRTNGALANQREAAPPANPHALVDATAPTATAANPSATLLADTTAAETASSSNANKPMPKSGGKPAAIGNDVWQAVTTAKVESRSAAPTPAASASLFLHARNILAVVGVLALLLRAVR